MATAADLALLYQPLIRGGRVYGGGQILQPETIDNVLAKQQTDDKHFTILSHGDGAYVDQAAWKAGDIDASSVGIPLPGGGTSVAFPKRREPSPRPVPSMPHPLPSQPKGSGRR